MVNLPRRFGWYCCLTVAVLSSVGVLLMERLGARTSKWEVWREEAKIWRERFAGISKPPHLKFEKSE